MKTDSVTPRKKVQISSAFSTAKRNIHLTPSLTPHVWRHEYNPTQAQTLYFA